MPYTIEILALEFNRTKEQIENAMKVFCDLNMVCVDENGVSLYKSYGIDNKLSYFINNNREDITNTKNEKYKLLY